MKDITKQNLFNNISNLIREARNNVHTAVNSAIVITYWNIGKLIVEDEQQGKLRAEYGKAVLKELSQKLTSNFGQGFDVTNLRKMRQFYSLFPKRDAVSLELSWTHFRHLLKIENEKARFWYRDEVLKCLAERPSVLQARSIRKKIIEKMKGFVRVFVEGIAA